MAAQAPVVCDFGWRAVDFSLRGTDGKIYALKDVRGPKGTLVMFICNHCPYVQAVVDRIVRDVLDLEKEGVGAVAIMPNDPETYPEDSFDNMIAFGRKHGFPFPYLIDETQAVALAYGAACTPDFFGFNADLKLQYRGRLDDSGRSPHPGARRELYEAMREIARTGKGPAHQIPSIGCSIKWRAAA